MKIPEQHLPTCVELLARTDALFVPCRYGEGPGRTPQKAVWACWEARERYRRAGLPFDGGGQGAERVAKHRELLALRRAGVVAIRGSGKGRGVRLTDAAYDSLATLCGCYRADESWELLELIDRLGRLKVLENDILGPHGRKTFTSRELVQIEQRATPLLVRGWLDSNSDGQGHVGYFIEGDGEAALKAGRPGIPESLPDYDEHWANRYDQIHQAALDERDAARPDARASIVIPLGCGSWSLPVIYAEGSANG